MPRLPLCAVSLIVILTSICLGETINWFGRKLEVLFEQNPYRRSWLTHKWRNYVLSIQLGTFVSGTFCPSLPLRTGTQNGCCWGPAVVSEPVGQLHPRHSAQATPSLGATEVNQRVGGGRTGDQVTRYTIPPFSHHVMPPSHKRGSILHIWCQSNGLWWWPELRLNFWPSQWYQTTACIHKVAVLCTKGLVYSDIHIHGNTVNSSPLTQVDLNWPHSQCILWIQYTH